MTPYSLSASGPLHFIALGPPREFEGLATMANSREFTNLRGNADFAAVNDRIYLMTVADVAPGEELLVLQYGAGYWMVGGFKLGAV
jgi:hypothetical protein